MTNSLSISANLGNVGDRRPLRCPVCHELFPGDFRVCPRDAVSLVEPTEDDPMIGTVLNETYRIVRQLGEGGMGRVYEAQHTRLVNRRYAIKLMHAHLARHAEVVERFRREAETACSIDHPNLIDVFDIDCSSEGIPYIAYEYLDGEDLGQVLEREGRLDEATTARIMRQVCRALEAAHQLGIVHRDMKPENIFVVGGLDKPLIKLIDFGIARVEDPAKAMHTKTGLIMGTPAYMAPEQALASKVDYRADIYSVGAILYRMLTGFAPYGRDDPAETLRALLTEEPVRPCMLSPSVSAAFELVIQRAMARDPAERYASMVCLEEELEAFAPEVEYREAAEGVPLPTTDNTGTLMFSTAAQSRQRTARASRRSRGARPWIVFGMLLAIVSSYGLIVETVEHSLEVATGVGLPTPWFTIFAIATAALMLTPVIFAIKRIARSSWQNSVQAVALARRFRHALALGLGLLGLASLALAVVQRFVDLSADITLIRLCVYSATVLVGLSTFLLTREES